MNRDNSKTVFLLATAAALGLMLWTKPQRQVYPPKQSINRIFTTIQSPDELQAILGTPVGSRGTLYLGFVRLGQPESNKMAESLWTTMAKTKFITKEEVGAVCVELDGGRNDKLIDQYIIQKVPSIVKLEKGILTNDRTDELNAEKLKEWVVKTLR